MPSTALSSEPIYKCILLRKYIMCQGLCYFFTLMCQVTHSKQQAFVSIFYFSSLEIYFKEDHFNLWGLVVYICVINWVIINKWLVVCWESSLNLNQYWLVLNWNAKKQLLSNLHQEEKIHLKMSSSKSPTFCSGLNMLRLFKIHNDSPIFPATTMLTSVWGYVLVEILPTF